MQSAANLLDDELLRALAGEQTLQLMSHAPADTQKLAGRVARMLAEAASGAKNRSRPDGLSSQVIALTGDLGAGKTTFVQGFCHGLGIKQRPTSPTFTLLHVYDSNSFPVYHFDFYRLQSVEELEALGCEEYFESDGFSIVEWPELGRPLMPANTLWVSLAMPDFVNQPEVRHIEIGQRPTVHENSGN